MNMKTGSRIIAGLGMAALLMLSTACQQAAGTDTPTPPSADQVKVNEVAATIKGNVLNTLRQGFDPELKAGAGEVAAGKVSIVFTASTAKLGDLKTALKDGGDAKIVFEGPKDKTSNIVESSTAGTYTVTHGEKAESWKIFVKLTKKKAEKKVEIGTYTVKADDTLAELAAAAKKINVAELQGQFNPKATAGVVDIPVATTSITIPQVPSNLGTDITASWESSDTATISTNGTVTHPAYAQGDKTCVISLKLTKNGKSKSVPVVTFKVLKKAATTEEQQAEKDVAEIKKMIEQHKAAVQEKFNPKLTGGKATIPATLNSITVPEASSFGTDLKGVNVSVAFAKPNGVVYTSKIEYSSGTTNAAVTHGDNDEKWGVALILEKEGIINHVELGTYTVAKKAAPVKTPLSIKEIAKITVDSVPAAGTANAYTVALEESKFNALTADAEGAKKVVIAAAAINGLEAAGYDQSKIFDVAVEDKGATKVVKIKLAAGAEAKYTFAEVTITVTKGASGTPSAQDLVDAEAAKITGDVLTGLQQGITGADGAVSNATTAVGIAKTIDKIILPALPQTANDIVAAWVSSDAAITLNTQNNGVGEASVTHTHTGDKTVTIKVKFSKSGAADKEVLVATFTVKDNT